MSEWQPIDTVPFGGTVILYHPSWGVFFDTYYDVDDMNSDVTHWMPMPEPPK